MIESTWWEFVLYFLISFMVGFRLCKGYYNYGNKRYIISLKDASMEDMRGFGQQLTDKSKRIYVVNADVKIIELQ